MKEDGYTLAEALAALLIVGLAIGGMVQGMHVLGRMQLAAVTGLREGTALRAANQGFANFVGRSGPFTSDRATLSGSSDTLSFGCAQTKTCTARLTQRGARLLLELVHPGDQEVRYDLGRFAQAHFVYASPSGEGDVWPPQDAQRTGRQTLKSISVLSEASGDEEDLVHVRLWNEHPVTCQFDMISQDCRDAPQ